MIKPAIVAIGYNRPSNLLRLLNGINNAKIEVDDVTLIISIDYGGSEEVVQVANNFKWNHGNKLIKYHTTNLGLRKHVLECADYSITYGAAIIFEDDTYPSPSFYSYVLQALECYQNNDKIFVISLYSQIWNGYANRSFTPLNNGYDAYISQIECSWGECFIGERWKEFKSWYLKYENNLEHSYEVPQVVFSWGKSYSKYLLNYVVQNEKYYLTPYESFSTNFNSKGTHISKSSSMYQTPLAYGTRKYRFPQFDDAELYDACFESIRIKKHMTAVMDTEVLIDYFGLKRNYSDYRYVLSTALLPFEYVKSYALEMRPYELNILNEISGDDIFLYDISKPKRVRRNWRHHFNMVKYEVKNLAMIDSLFYFLYSLLQKNHN